MNMRKQRGRPRKFNEETVKSAILQTFWEKGYAATSLDDLSEASGLVRPSLYGAFGSKRDMYLMSMDVFLEKLSASRKELNLQQTAHGALSAFYRSVIDVYVDETGPSQLGCFLVGTALTEAPESNAIKEALAERLDRLRQLLWSVLAAKTPNANDASLTFAAEQAAATLHSVAVRARSGENKETLVLFAEKSSAFITQILITK